MLMMMARRGSLIFASRTVRRFISHFYTAVTEPWGWTHGTDGIPANNFVTNAGSFTWDETNVSRAITAGIWVAFFQSVPAIIARLTGVESRNANHRRQFRRRWLRSKRP